MLLLFQPPAVGNIGQEIQGCRPALPGNKGCTKFHPLDIPRFADNAKRIYVWNFDALETLDIALSHYQAVIGMNKLDYRPGD